MFKPSRYTVEFEEGISRAYPSLASYLREYLPYMCSKRETYNMKSLAADMDLSPSQLSQKLSESPSCTARFTTVDLDRLYEVLTPDECQPIIAYQVEKTLGQHSRIEELEQELATLKAVNLQNEC